jgi:4-amino-4-deoxy-L-arabinose transferase-like glycosyltransferase
MKKRYWAWLLLIAGMIFCRAAFLEDIFYNIDEAEYAVAANALNHGWLPGVDLLGSTKPPGIVLLYNLLFHLFGQSLAALHVVHLLIMIATGFLVVELAMALWGEAASIPSAALFWMVSNSYELPGETLALNVESPAMLFTMAALLLAWTKPKVNWALLLTGLLLGIGALFRQSITVFFVPIAVAVCVLPERRLERVSLVASGFILAWLPVIAVYAATGNLGWAWDSWVRYPLTYSSDAGLTGFFLAFWTNGTNFVLEALVPFLLMLAGAALLWRERKSPRARFLFWLFVACAVAIASGSRFFGHYWIQLYPVAALIGTAAWLHFQTGSQKVRRVLIVAVLFGAAWAVGHFPLWRSWDPYAFPRGMSYYALGSGQLELKIGDFARSHTSPDETITVWGYCPQIYYYAQRLPGTRDYLCHYTTGYSPGTFDPRYERAVRSSGHADAQQMFVRDLETRKPKYIFDLVQVTDYEFTFYNYSLRSYPEIAAYVRQNYLPEGTIGNVPIYRRRTPQDTWWPDNDTQPDSTHVESAP